MIMLPRGNPVNENLDPGKLNLPEAFATLQGGVFTGYLRFKVRSGTGILIFEQGRLVSALFQQNEERSTGRSALSLIFVESLHGGGLLDIYSLSSELALSIHALLHGNFIHQGQEVELIDIEALLARLTDEQVSGCLRIYTKERVALIFYRQGQSLGFFHDGSVELEQTADNSMAVAKLPGAKIDFLSSRDAEELEKANLLRSLAINELWDEARLQVAQELRAKNEEAVRQRELQESERRKNLLMLLDAIAERHLGRIGAIMTEKEFHKTVTAGGSLQEVNWNEIFDRIGKAAKLVAGPGTIRLMLEEMKEGVKNVLKSHYH